MTNQKLLVTGGAGYIGAVLVPELLEEGHHVTVFDAFLYGTDPSSDPIVHPRCERIRGDIRDFAALDAVLEQGGEITFLFKIVPGSTDHSYGIYAGKVAGLPRSVIERAQAILHQLEFGRTPQADTPPPDKRVKVQADDGMLQLSLFDGLTHPVIERLRGLETDRLTPLEALRLLSEIADEVK